MEQIFNFFNQGWVGSLIGIVGVISGIVGIFSYKISRSTAKPAFQKRSLHLLGREKDNLPDAVVITYNGVAVDQLTKNTIVIWNNGTEVLNGEDLVKSDQLRIQLPEGTNLLSWKISKTTKDANNFLLSQVSSNKLEINFTYLDPNDGASIELLHDSKENYPKILGTIRGLPKGVEDLGTIVYSKPIKNSSPFNILIAHPKLILWITLLVGIGFMVLGLLPHDTLGLQQALKLGNDAISPKWSLVIAGSLYAVMPALLLWSRRAKYPKSLTIEDIES